MTKSEIIRILDKIDNINKQIDFIKTDINNKQQLINKYEDELKQLYKKFKQIIINTNI